MSGGLKNLAEHSAQKKHVQVFLVYTSQQALIRVEALPSLAASGIKLNPSGQGLTSIYKVWQKSISDCPNQLKPLWNLRQWQMDLFFQPAVPPEDDSGVGEEEGSKLQDV